MLIPGLYLSLIYDEQTQKVISTIIDCNMMSDLVVRTLQKALTQAHHPDYLHSDIGSQYTNFEFERILSINNI